MQLAHCLLLDEPPHPDDISAWRKRLDDWGLSRRRLLVELFLSAAGQREWGPLSDQELIARLHRRLFSREPDRATAIAWDELLRQGVPRRSLLRVAIMSDEFARLYPTFEVHPTGSAACPQVHSLVDTDQDASTELQRCIDAAPVGSEIALPPGKYTLTRTLRLFRPIVLRTKGLPFAAQPCAAGDRHGCAELFTSASFQGGPLLVVDTDAVGVVVDHIVMNGNKDGRVASEANCKQNPSRFGPVFAGNGNRNLILRNSVAKQALCSTGIGIVGQAEIHRNAAVRNGRHTEGGLWADGMILLLHDSWVTENVLEDNTDIDMILGGCRNCDVQNNSIRHRDDDGYYHSASFAALMVHAAPDGSGDYTGADLSQNVIDCGSKAACGYGLLLGADPWYPSKLFGGAYHHNVIRNAHQGFAINGATGTIVVYDNIVERSGGRPNAACKLSESVAARTTAYNIAPSSRPHVDLSRDRMRARYTSLDFRGCLLNSHEARACHELGGNASDSPCADTPIAIAYDTPYCCTR